MQRYKNLFGLNWTFAVLLCIMLDIIDSKEILLKVDFLLIVFHSLKDNLLSIFSCTVSFVSITIAFFTIIINNYEKDVFIINIRDLVKIKTLDTYMKQLILSPIIFIPLIYILASSKIFFATICLCLIYIYVAINSLYLVYIFYNKDKCENFLENEVLKGCRERKFELLDIILNRYDDKNCDNVINFIIEILDKLDGNSIEDTMICNLICRFDDNRIAASLIEKGEDRYMVCFNYLHTHGVEKMTNLLEEFDICLDKSEKEELVKVVSIQIYFLFLYSKISLNGLNLLYNKTIGMVDIERIHINYLFHFFKERSGLEFDSIHFNDTIVLTIEKINNNQIAFTDFIMQESDNYGK